MSSRREKFFHNKVIQNLYQNDDSADEETIEKPSEEFIVNTVLTKRKVALQQDTSDVDWSVPLPKLKKVYTVNVRPEDLQKATTNSVPTTSNQKEESAAEQEKRISKNKKRKLKKKRQKEKERQKRSSASVSSREFTY